MKEYIWELDGYSGSVYAKSYADARKKLLNELSIQECENE